MLLTYSYPFLVANHRIPQFLEIWNEDGVTVDPEDDMD